MQSIERRIVAAYIVSADGKLLLGRKDPHRPSVYPDCWHTPGGGVDGTETDEAALIREVREETGIDIAHAQITLIDSSGTGETVKQRAGGEPTIVKMQFHIFRVKLAVPAQAVSLQASDDLVRLGWFTKDELMTLKLTPPSVDLFTRLGSGWLYS